MKLRQVVDRIRTMLDIITMGRGKGECESGRVMV